MNKSINESDEGLELDNDEIFEGIYAKTFGPELLDCRLSSSERLFYIWLRYRNTSNIIRKLNGDTAPVFVKYKTIADDFGVDIRTVMRWVEKLESINFIRSEKIDKSPVKKKFVKSPHQIYGTEFVSSFVSLLSKERTPEHIAIARSEHLRNTDSNIQSTHDNNVTYTHDNNVTCMSKTHDNNVTSYKDLPLNGESIKTKEKKDPVLTDCLPFQLPLDFMKPTVSSKKEGYSQTAEGGLPAPARDPGAAVAVHDADDRATVAKSNMFATTRRLEDVSAEKDAKKEAKNSYKNQGKPKIGRPRTDSGQERINYKQKDKHYNKPSQWKLVESWWIDTWTQKGIPGNHTPFQPFTKTYLNDLYLSHPEEQIRQAITYLFDNWSRIRDDAKKRNQELASVPEIKYFTNNFQILLDKSMTTIDKIGPSSQGGLITDF